MPRINFKKIQKAIRALEVDRQSNRKLLRTLEMAKASIIAKILVRIFRIPLKIFDFQKINIFQRNSKNPD